MKMIPTSQPSLGEEELAEVQKVFKSGWLGMGSWVKDFENNISAYLGGGEVVAVNTGTNAIHLALEILDLNPGDEVLVPSLTFVATAQAIMMAGGVPVFCDVEKDTLNLSVDDVKKKITSKTRAILPVHYRGLPCDMDSFLHLAKKNNLVVVEDAAHAFGSSYSSKTNNHSFEKYPNKKIGSFGHLTCFSFDPIKNITCGEGGAIVTNNKAWVEKLKLKRNLGIDKDSWNRYKHERSWYYDVVEKGYRYHMSNINAAIGVIQLKKVDDFIDRKRKLAEQYDEIFSDSFFDNKIQLLKSDYSQMAIFSYIVKVLNDDRDKMLTFLKTKGIVSGVHYIPNHKQRICLDFRSENLVNTEIVSTQILTLPLYYMLSDNDQKYVVDSIREFYD